MISVHKSLMQLTEQAFMKRQQYKRKRGWRKSFHNMDFKLIQQRETGEILHWTLPFTKSIQFDSTCLPHGHSDKKR